MQQQEIHQFLKRYFTANQCEITESDESFITVQLTVELDKELMNRPFYWHYLEKTGGIPNPMKLTLITDPQQAPKDLKGEMLYFGSPRLHQIFHSTKNLAGYIRLYEAQLQKVNGQTPLFPWLGLNIKVSYQCDRKRDVFHSFGLHLINGRMVKDFHNELLKLKLTPKIPDYRFTMSPLIMPKSGINRIITQLTETIEAEDDTWANEALMRWDQDLKLLNHFYEDEEDEEKLQSYEIEKTALKDQYEPRIKISIINGGLFYLTKEAI